MQLNPQTKQEDPEKCYPCCEPGSDCVVQFWPQGCNLFKIPNAHIEVYSDVGMTDLIIEGDSDPVSGIASLSLPRPSEDPDEYTDIYVRWSADRFVTLETHEQYNKEFCNRTDKQFHHRLAVQDGYYCTGNCYKPYPSTLKVQWKFGIVTLTHVPVSTLFPGIGSGWETSSGYTVDFPGSSVCPTPVSGVGVYFFLMDGATTDPDYNMPGSSLGFYYHIDLSSFDHCPKAGAITTSDFAFGGGGIDMYGFDGSIYAGNLCYATCCFGYIRYLPPSYGGLYKSILDPYATCDTVIVNGGNVGGQIELFYLAESEGGLGLCTSYTNCESGGGGEMADCNGCKLPKSNLCLFWTSSSAGPSRTDLVWNPGSNKWESDCVNGALSTSVKFVVSCVDDLWLLEVFGWQSPDCPGAFDDYFSTDSTGIDEIITDVYDCDAMEFEYSLPPLSPLAGKYGIDDLRFSGQGCDDSCSPCDLPPTTDTIEVSWGGTISLPWSSVTCVWDPSYGMWIFKGAFASYCLTVRVFCYPDGNIEVQLLYTKNWQNGLPGCGGFSGYEPQVMIMYGSRTRGDFVLNSSDCDAGVIEYDVEATAFVGTPASFGMTSLTLVY